MTALIVIVVLAVVVIGWAIMAYNRLVALRTQVANAWSQIDVQLKRRYDLIPNLVETVKGAAAFETDTFTAVTEARAKVGQVQVNAGALNADAIGKFQAAQDGLSSALSRLLVVV